MGAVAVASWVFVAAAHVDDGYGVDHVSGAWMALARYADEGTLYPPLYDGERFGGTRYMPIPILLHAGVARVTGEYLVSGKVLAYVLMASLLALAFVLLRREGCPRSVALGLTGTLLVTGSGLTAATAIRSDTLPVVLQLGAIALVMRSTRPRSLVGAGGLCALAFCTKLSAVWAPLAVGLWLLARERRSLSVFVAGFLVPLATMLALFEATTDGRLTENVLRLSFAGSRGFESVTWELSRVRYIFGEGLGPARILLVIAVAATLLAFRRRRATLYDVSLVAALAVLVVVLADRGVFANQLLDAQVLAVLVLGGLWSGSQLRPRERAPVRVAVAACVLAVAAVAYAGNANVQRAASDLFRGDEPRDKAALLAAWVDPSERILSEDPYVPISLGQLPIVLDAFMLVTIAESHPAWRDDLVSRLDAREFDTILLFYRPETARYSEAVRFWYGTEHFGPEITAAVVRNYSSVTKAAGLWVYRRRA